MITINNKTVEQPYVAVDGEWKKVSSEYVMVNGEWKKVFPDKKTFTVRTYRYGYLEKTFTVTEGESVTLPSLGIGYATSSNSTAVSYNGGATITPTGDMNLYAVFNYTLNIYRFGSLYQTLTSKTQNRVGSFTLPSYGIGYATSSSSTTVSYSKGETVEKSGGTLYIVYEYSIKLYKYGALYDTLTSKSQSSTATFTLPTCTPNTGETFYGWTTTSGSTTKDYASGASVTTSGMTLYAIFSYETTSTKTEYATNDTVLTVTIPTACTVTIGGGNSYNGTSGGIGSGGVNGLTFDASTGSDKAYCMVDGTYITGTTSQSNGTLGNYSDSAGYTVPVFKLAQTIDATKGTIIKIKAPANINIGSGYDSSNNYYAVGIQYSTVTTNYRSTK